MFNKVNKDNEYRVRNYIMTGERVYFSINVGNVLIRKRKGSKRMSIRINHMGEVRMIIPYFTKYSIAERFLEEKVDWIINTRKKIQSKKIQKNYYTVDNLPKTKHHEFLITRTLKNELSFRIGQGLCEIFIPEKDQIASDKVQDWIRTALTETLRKEAKVILVNRCRELGKDHGFKVKDIRVKNMKTRWGSCSSRGNINLNIHLMRLPAHLSDYVIYHELVHTVHPNHSLAFWGELDKYVGKAKEYARELRTWGWLLQD